MLFWVRSCSFLLVYCLSTLCLTRPRSTLASRGKNTQPLCLLIPNFCSIPNRSLSSTSSSPSASFVARPRASQLFLPTRTPPALRKPSKYRSAYPAILGLIAAFLPHGFCYGYENHRRNTAHTTSYAVNGTYTGIGGAGGACEEEDAFALSPFIRKSRGLGRPLRGRIHPLVAAKRTSVELMTLKLNLSNPIARACRCQGTGCMLSCVGQCTFFVYCPSTFNFGLTCSRSNSDPRFNHRVFFPLLVPNVCLIPIELLPAPPPVLKRPFCLGLELYNRLYPLGHLQAPNNHRPPWTRTCPGSSVLPPRLLLRPSEV